jgi:hypothetical protein
MIIMEGTISHLQILLALLTGDSEAASVNIEAVSTS